MLYFFDGHFLKVARKGSNKYRYNLDKRPVNLALPTAIPNRLDSSQLATT